MRRPLLKFAEAMEGRLQENDHKGRYGWRRDDRVDLFLRLLDEVRELTGSVLRPEQVATFVDRDAQQRREIMSELLDVANFCMMLYDNEAAAEAANDGAQETRT